MDIQSHLVFWLPWSARLLVFYMIMFTTNSSHAQVIPDETLGAESTIIKQLVDTGTEIYQVEGGATRGSIQFHSFEELSIAPGQELHFSSNINGISIFSRVTGASSSRIDGLIKTDQGTNLFLMNPNGIIFGPNSSLNVGGTFAATTADAISFGDGYTFSASQDTFSPPPLLEFSSPTGLQFGNNAQAIQIVGSAEDASQLDNSALERGNLIILGNEVNFSNSKLQSSNGRIEIGSVSPGSTLGLEMNFDGYEINYEDVLQYSPINISENSIINMSGEGGGRVVIRGSEIILSGKSRIISDTIGSDDGQGIDISSEKLYVDSGSFISSVTQGSGNSGDISINTTEEVVITGQGIELFHLIFTFGALQGTRTMKDQENGGIFAGTNGTGSSGMIRIIAPTLILNNGAIISNQSLGKGNSGNIKVQADNRILIDGSGITTATVVPGIPIIDENFATTGNSTLGVPSGNAGDINIETQKLTLQNGGVISAGTLSDGNAGNVDIVAYDTIELLDFVDVSPVPTGINSVTIGGSGSGGRIELDTGKLLVLGGSFIFTNSGVLNIEGITTFGGKAGDITISAAESIYMEGSVLEGAFFSNILSETFSQESAGTIQIFTPNLRIANGAQISTRTLGEGEGGQIFIRVPIILEIMGTGSNDNQPTGIFNSSGDESRSSVSGDVQGIPGFANSGGLSINAGSVIITDGAEISVSSLGEGQAGDLTVVSNNINIDHQSKITATTRGGEGNVVISGNSIFLNDGSSISTDAFGASSGGNISIDSDTLTIFNNSDITANATEGNGGNIRIVTTGLFVADLNAITASSEFSQDGVVTINSPNLDLAGVFVDNSEQISLEDIPEGCQVSTSTESYFINSGKGGVTPEPKNAISGGTIWEDLDPPNELLEPTIGTSKTTDQIMFAVKPKGLSLDHEGNVVLINERVPIRCLN